MTRTIHSRRGKMAMSRTDDLNAIYTEIKLEPLTVSQLHERLPKIPSGHLFAMLYDLAASGRIERLEERGNPIVYRVKK